MGTREKSLLASMRDRNTVMQEHDLGLILDSAGAVETLQHKGFYMLYYRGTGGALANGDTFTFGPVTYEFQDVEGAETAGNIWVDLSPPAGDRGAAVIAAINATQPDDLLASYDQSDISAQVVALTDVGAAFSVSDTMTGAVNFLSSLLSGQALQKITYEVVLPAGIAGGPDAFSVPIPGTWNFVRGVKANQFSPFGGATGKTGFQDNATLQPTWDLNTGPGDFQSVEIFVATPAFIDGDLFIIEIWGHE